MSSKRVRTSEAGTSDPNQPPKWAGKKRLTELPARWQTHLYHEKFSKIKNLEDAIVAERQVDENELKYFGFIEAFRKIGWEAALLFNNNASPNIYLNEIMQWIASLRKVEGRNHPWDTELVGKVNQRVVKMNLQTLNEIANFSSLPHHEYEGHTDGFILSEGMAEGEEWDRMLLDLFNIEYLPPTGIKLYARDLKPLPRLISKILTFNVIPRRSDKEKIRFEEIRTLHSLITGSPKYPFHQLIMLNIWESRESCVRTIIPHCRLISRLLENAKVLGRDPQPVIEPQIVFNKKQIGWKEFSFKVLGNGERRLLDERSRCVHAVPRPTDTAGNLLPWQIGRVLSFSELMHEQAVRSREREGEEARRREGETHDMGQSSQGVHTGQGPTMHYEGAENFYTDMQQMMLEQQENMRRWKEEQEEVQRCNIYQAEKYYNNIFEWSENIRHRENYRAGLPYQETYTPVDYPSWYAAHPVDAAPVLPHEMPPLPPYPQMAPPDWWPSGSQSDMHFQPASGEGTSSSNQPNNPFDTSELGRGLYESIFGPYHGSR